ncbi:hypothetical protein [Pontimicrobium aquaticum]|uniref:Tetratricopeptide repeat protein n=1 Tax=Pontimicrobium aquaticum TaxID=2565367 RepID=A0A4U0EYC9_9FLAO|nr:hypothetical protein [Pontimicrobium aquaticum]TJY37027.1 hypothetical protein E5167_03530 [Pontimicrobium aquaticum]
MNTSNFTYLLQNPKHISVSQVSDVRTIIDEYPYFQPARAIYLKGLKDLESFKYNQELKTTAAYTTDRSILFDFITSDEFQQNQISEHIKKNIAHLKNIEVNDVEDISVNKSVIIDDALKQHIKDTEPTIRPDLFEAKQEFFPQENIIQVDSLNIKKTPEEVLEVGKPLEFNKSEVHSFSEWLKITSFKPIIREEGNLKSNFKPEEDTKAKKFELIDRFIATSPKIRPVKKDTPVQNLAQSRMIQPEALMTETLARIYVEQKNYDKAIQSYKILSLKYPEKSGFFADQIQAIKEIQEQNNK